MYICIDTSLVVYVLVKCQGSQVLTEPRKSQHETPQNYRNGRSKRIGKVM